ncbi:hypothetical protein L861_17230 [Litchfieldella anticariensis FP35 = DSM 16096]|uniref:Uncharacterized protein n=1 Tax=Litchfieldella anticariensis (strain DSM 16096 / CECT 5854 / CIP 108499 / LMG 22089 / FP35) TaxID=1121939 RepID=S2KMY3_LITA3|nr:hypothetical protein L861_17230 [Halomonas anticariensis FP35 = DSM 16096]
MAKDSTGPAVILRQGASGWFFTNVGDEPEPCRASTTKFMLA